ncbi:MAG: F0F1 ATP synthase subunit B [Gemmatimonadota bacterium]|nr:F0F1 ATP synthase subunit B [Gemmatimonadota bacterium]
MLTRRIAAAVALLVLLPDGLLAAEGGSGIFSLNLGLVVWTWVLFLLTLAVLAWKAFPAIAGGLEKRQSRIQEAIDSARADREEARRLLDEHQRQLDEARRESKELLAQGREAGERLREEILARARAEHEEMLERARREMARERDETMASVRSEVVDIALAAAERVVRERLDDEGNRRLVTDFLAEVE